VENYVENVDNPTKNPHFTVFLYCGELLKDIFLYTPSYIFFTFLLIFYYLLNFFLITPVIKERFF